MKCNILPTWRKWNKIIQCSTLCPQVSVKIDLLNTDIIKRVKIFPCQDKSIGVNCAETADGLAIVELAVIPRPTVVTLTVVGFTGNPAYGALVFPLVTGTGNGRTEETGKYKAAKS